MVSIERGNAIVVRFTDGIKRRCHLMKCNSS